MFDIGGSHHGKGANPGCRPVKHRAFSTARSSRLNCANATPLGDVAWWAYGR